VTHNEKSSDPEKAAEVEQNQGAAARSGKIATIKKHLSKRACSPLQTSKLSWNLYQKPAYAKLYAEKKEAFLQLPSGMSMFAQQSHVSPAPVLHKRVQVT